MAASRAVALLLVAAAEAHISMNPNYGAASGGYFLSSMKVPHGAYGMHTSRMVLHVPKGVMSVKPEVPAGWNVSVESYTLDEEDQYMSHGNAVTTGPSKVIFQAETVDAMLYTDHLMMINLQMKIGCSFRDEVDTSDYSGSNSIWQGQYTLWFKVEQHSSYDGTLEISSTYMWAGALADTVTTSGNETTSSSPSWNPPSDSGLKACPYVFIYPGTRCQASEDESVSGGMNWMGSYLPPVANQAAVKSEEHVISLATEAALTAQENLEEIYADHVRVDALEDQQMLTLILAIVGVGVSCCVAGVFFALCCFRLVDKESFARNVAAVPLMAPPTPTTKGDVELKITSETNGGDRT
jgi:uncharacterized protein YcnI